MSASNLELVRHILTETAFIIQHTDKKTKEQVIEDEVLCRAVVRSIEIIGEASKKIDEEFKATHIHIECPNWTTISDKLFSEGKLSKVRNPSNAQLTELSI